MATTTALSTHIQPIYLSHAHLFTYESSSRQWTPVEVHPVPTSIMFDATRGLYRLISVDPSCKHVIANSTIVSDLEFHKTSQKFGHWTDQATGIVYGIGFRTDQQLQDFADCIRKAKAAFTGSTRLKKETHQQSLTIPPPEIKTLRELIAHLGISTEPPVENSNDFSFPSFHPPAGPPPQFQESNQEFSTNLISEINHLRQENAEMRSSLASTINQYQSCEEKLDSFRSQNLTLSQTMTTLNSQIEERKKLNFDIQAECDLLKDHYLTGASAKGKYEQLEERYGKLMGEKSRLESELRRSSTETAPPNQHQGSSVSFVDCSKQAEELEEHYKGLLEKANRALSDALQENMTGKEIVLEVEGLFCNALKELGRVQGDISGAFGDHKNNNNTEK